MNFDQFYKRVIFIIHLFIIHFSMRLVLIRARYKGNEREKKRKEKVRKSKSKK